MPHSYLRLAAAGVLAGAIACGSVNSVRLRGASTNGDRVTRPGTMPDDLGRQPANQTPRRPEAGPGAGAGIPGERQVCRTAAIPRGWIAVAYVSSSGQCPGRVGADSTATAAILARYADQAIGMQLDVCADQVVPSGWALSSDEVDDVDRCPGASRGDAPTTKRIRRIQ